MVTKTGFILHNGIYKVKIISYRSLEGLAMYCTQCGQPVAEASKFCCQCGTKVALASTPEDKTLASSKEDILTAVAGALMQNDHLTLTYRQKTDIGIYSTLADVNWTVGKKKIEYFASILAEENSQTIVLWEMIKETSCGFDPVFSFTTEKFYSDGKTTSGKITECGTGLDEKVIDYQWDYSQISLQIQHITLAKGWRFKKVINQGNASY